MGGIVIVMSRLGVRATAVLFGLVLTVSGALAQAVAGSPLEYAYPEQSVWTTRVDERGDPENPLLRLAEAIFQRAGIAWKGQRYPAGRVFTNLNDGTSHFSMLVKAPALADCCVVGKAPVASTELRIYRLAGRSPIRSKEDLAGKRVITIRGYSYAGVLDFIANPANGITNSVTIKHDAAFAMLEAGRGDYLLDYNGPAAEVLNARPVAGIQYDVLSRMDIYMVLTKSYPGAAQLMARLEGIAEGLNKEEIMGISLR